MLDGALEDAETLGTEGLGRARCQPLCPPTCVLQAGGLEVPVVAAVGHGWALPL